MYGFQAFHQTKELLDEFVSSFKLIEEKRKRRTGSLAPEINSRKASNQAFEEPPPDDYRQLDMIPEIQEILQNRKPYLRANIIDGIYDDPRHYLDVSDCTATKLNKSTNICF